MEKLFSSIIEWQEETFPKSTAISKLKHAKEEIDELIEELSKEQIDIDALWKEYADVLLLVFGSAYKAGYTNIKTIANIMDKKLTINKKRVWNKPDENGIVRHIKIEKHENN